MSRPDRELSDAEITRLVREVAYANQRAFFDLPAKHVEGRKQKSLFGVPVRIMDPMKTNEAASLFYLEIEAML